MANPTSNFGWQMPTSTDLVTDLPADFEVFGQAVDTDFVDLLGGANGYILSKASATDLDFAWIPNDQGDITAVNVTAPITGGGTAGAVTIGVSAASTSASGVVQLSDSTSTTSSVLASTPTATKSAYDLADTANTAAGTAQTTANNAIAKSTVTTAGDIIYRNATVPARLGIGTAGQVLTVNSGATAPEWTTIATGQTFYGCQVTSTTDFSISNGTDTALTWNTEQFDSGGYHSTATNTSRFTIPAGKGGYYLLSAQTTWGANATGNRVNSIRKNGTQQNINVTGYGANVTITGSYVLNQTWLVNAAVADYYELYAQQSSGGTLAVLAGGTFASTPPSWFSITYLGA
jgi:hypothetical protein